MRSVLNHYSLIVKNTWYKKREDIFKYLPFFVESPRIELGSKQATKELSTRLFPDWIFVVKLGQEQPLNTYLLNFEIHPKLMEI
ncbi:hypothetical protein OA93_20985 [Flavobacterium sp. KMS]|nr:hypothetical protein OA93_20985 [Flavobacterium sp. KMS]KIC02685.1 hypothetical protein OA88_07075 [Flavobacterium sp. JRM]